MCCSGQTQGSANADPGLLYVAPSGQPEETQTMLTKAYIPFRGYYSSPFSRWQGSMATENSITLAADTSKRWLAGKNWDPKIFDYLFLGITTGQPKWFYGSPWAAALLGAPGIPGMTISQACTTSATCLYQAAIGVETGLYSNPFCLMTDRCSNEPHPILAQPRKARGAKWNLRTGLWTTSATIPGPAIP